MSIAESNVIDGVGISKDNNHVLGLFLADHLDWKDEYQHLLALQEKINSYISYVETKQYEETYPNHQIDAFLLDIHFKYDITENCEKLLNVVAEQVAPLNMSIQATISSD